MRASLLLSLALSGAAFAPSLNAAVTVPVVTDNASGIQNATLTATTSDGTTYGFYRSGSNAYFNGAISTKTSLSVPDSIDYNGSRYPVKYIGYNSTIDFSKAQSVTDLTIPATTTSLNSLPSTVKTLHTNSFFSNFSTSVLKDLDKVLVPASLLSSYLGESYWRDYVLVNAEGTQPLKITIAMTKAGEFAQLLLEKQSDWNKVNELTVTGPLNSDDLSVFKRFRQLTRLDLSSAQITSIPDQFGGATSVSASRNGMSILEEAILPELNSIGKYAFAQTFRLKKITIPKVKSILYGAFAYSSIPSITLPEGFSQTEGYIFYNSGLKSITIPSTISEIGRYDFYRCESLASATIPASVKTIGEYAFQETPLTSLSLPGVTEINYGAFYKCDKLTSVTFSPSLETLNSEAFRDCTSLTEIILPGKVVNVNSGAFRGCYALKKVTSQAVVPPTHENGNFLMYGCDMTNVKLYVPASSVDLYRSDSKWKEFYTILPMTDKLSAAEYYTTATVDDFSQFAAGADITVNWRQQYRNSSSAYHCGAVDFNGSGTLSMGTYSQVQYLGDYNSNDNYSGNSHHTSLIANAPMRADNVKTTLQTNNDYTWYFITLPYDVKVSEITYTAGTQFVIRSYSGLNRSLLSGSTWLDLTADSTMHAHQGYILRTNKNSAEFTFPALNNANKNKVFESGDAVVTLNEYLSDFDHNRSWNLVGNPYPCHYDTRFMDFTAPITVWNRYYQRYDAYSPVDDRFILHPAQAFFVQRPLDCPSITFDKEGRQKSSAVRSLNSSARRAKAKGMSTRRIFNFALSANDATDRTRIVINEDASLGYELDKDASKLIDTDNKAMLLFSTVNGVRYAINERPMADGEAHLGIYAPEEGTFTLSIETTEAETVTLVDNVAGTEQRFQGDYTFTAPKGYSDNRFTVVIGSTTGVTGVDAGTPAAVTVTDGTVTADAPFTVYTIDGRLAASAAADEQVSLTPGVYVVSCKDVNRKIVVK